MIAAESIAKADHPHHGYIAEWNLGRNRRDCDAVAAAAVKPTHDIIQRTLLDNIRQPASEQPPGFTAIARSATCGSHRNDGYNLGVLGVAPRPGEQW